jgi:hypothetical protein
MLPCNNNSLCTSNYHDAPEQLPAVIAKPNPDPPVYYEKGSLLTRRCPKASRSSLFVRKVAVIPIPVSLNTQLKRAMIRRELKQITLPQPRRRISIS